MSTTGRPPLCNVCALDAWEDVAVQAALASKPKLHLYRDILEGAGFKRYLACHTGGFSAATIRFQFRCGTTILREESGRREAAAFEEMEDLMVDGEEHPQHCPHCTGAHTVETVQHVMTECPLYETIREDLHSGLRHLCPTAYLAFQSSDARSQTVQILRDDFWADAVPAHDAHTVLQMVNTYLQKLMDTRKEHC